MADTVMTAPHNPTTASTAQLIADWAASQRVNLDHCVPQILPLARRGGLAAGELQLATAEGQHSSIHVGSDRLFELASELIDLPAKRVPIVVDIAIGNSAGTDAPFTASYNQLAAARSAGAPLIISDNAQQAHDAALVAHLFAKTARSLCITATNGVDVAASCRGIETATEAGLQLLLQSAEGVASDLPASGLLTVEQTIKGLRAAMEGVQSFTSRRQRFFDYYGSELATVVLVASGPGAANLTAAVKLLGRKSLPIGLLVVRVVRPWSHADFAEALPATAQQFVVVDVTSPEDKQASKALYLDVAASLGLANRPGQIKLQNHATNATGQGISSQGLRSILRAALSFIVDVASIPSLLASPAAAVADTSVVSLYEFTRPTRPMIERAAAMAKLGAGAATVQMSTDSDAAPHVLISNILLGPEDEHDGHTDGGVSRDVVVITDPAILFLRRYRVFDSLATGAVVVINSDWSPASVAAKIPAHAQQALVDSKAQLLLVDATQLVSGGSYEAQALALTAAGLLNTKNGRSLAKQLLKSLAPRLAGDEGARLEAALPTLEARLAQEDALIPAASALQSTEVANDHTVDAAHLVPYHLAEGLRTGREEGLDASYQALLNTLFGKRTVVADAGSTNSLFHETYAPGSAAQQKVQELFQGNTEFTFGVYLARIQQREKLADLVATACRSTTALPSALRTALNQWHANRDNSQTCAQLADDIVRRLESTPHTEEPLRSIYELREHLVKPSKWIVGGDDWSRDIGYSGLHHVLASRENVNVIIPETALYTQPQPSQRAALNTKKDIGLYAMNYGTAYVASIALYENPSQATTALCEADAYDGPSIIIAYAPRPTNSNEPREQQQIRESHEAVERGLWPLFRWNPAWEKAGRDAFVLDSSKLRKDLADFVERESQLSLLTRDTPLLSHGLADSSALRLQNKRMELLSQGGGRRKIDMRILVLYGSDSGNGSGLAEKLAKKAEMRGVVTVRAAEANAVTLEELADEEVVIFILSTAGQGEMCGNAVNFWNALKKAKGGVNHLKYAVFGLGDSQYWGKNTADSARYYCKPARDLDSKMAALGAERLVELGMGDDQHENGFSGGWVPWEAEVFEVLNVPAVEGETEITGKVLKDESIKEESGYLRGHIMRSLADQSTAAMLPEDTKLTKFHGIYQQDDRDLRPHLEAEGKERAYSFMVRVGIPGGVCTPEQYLLMDSLSESHANSTLKLTTRQAFQLHGVLKWNLKAAIREINIGLMDTLAACGDVCRNVMASPNPYESEVHAEVLDFARRLSAHLKPQTTAYHEIWLDKKMVAGEAHTDVEPLYGQSYLPRKFKVAIAVPPMNDVDVFAHCLGYIAVVENKRLVGWNVSIGGGMGTTHGNVKTYPRLADLMGFCTPEQAIKVGEAVMLVQRDYGDRVNRKHARLKYTLEDHGMDWYRAKVEEHCGFKLQAARPFTFESNMDRMGWSQGYDGRFCYGMFIENGRIRDTDSYKLKTALRELAQLHQGDFRLTANQNLIIGGVTAEARPKIEALLKRYNIDNTRHSGLRLNSMACVALPTCALAMAESERYLPVLIDRIDEILTRNKLASDSIMIRMSGCPNGCSRPFMAEIAMVGKAPGAYNLYLGGGYAGNRLSKIYRDSASEEDILRILDELISRYARERLNNEHFGDWVIRANIVAPTLAGRLFHETDAAVNEIQTYSGTRQIYW
ncbi:uncharacterized protein MONBRDRAFT_32277 [Monosiga brevicollis MX1]|uniref:assimilatory sulfite reductase (NADPH) n=1 Tax=Monosiga brevicollis TaxID=81824 RepID=A9UYI0_MONBE|nr:uncharacterized protein MONBRDRAFT_32277 [Monosiga brevicollis MX1]EDQ89610.1 predicted protein [Monosiga brevicollis MX1]|eukprot:XP_001745639.1 hypothetical protein [Monosiga brevicollis MX1]